MGNKHSQSKKKAALVIGSPLGGVQANSAPLTSLKSEGPSLGELSALRKKIVKPSSNAEVKKLCKTLNKCAQLPNKHAVDVGDKSSAGSVWSSGVGYGNGSSNMRSLQAKKNFKEMEIQREMAIADGFKILTKVAGSKCETRSALLGCMKGSALVDYMETRLDNDSMMDIAAHSSFYIACWEFLTAVLRKDDLKSLVLRNADLKMRMRDWVTLADDYRATMATIGLQKQKNAEHEKLVELVLAVKPYLSRSRSAGRKRARSQRSPRKSSFKSTPVEKKDLPQEDVVMEEANSSSGGEEPAKKERKTSANSKPRKARKHKRSRKKREEPEPPMDPAVAAYVEQMTPLTFGTYSAGSGAGDVSFMARAMTELQSLAQLLPSLVHPDSSVFLRSNEKNITQMQAMIVGPKGTPYQNACFTFSIELPRSYPSQPPKCLITNTGGGRFRFNPNLYANGKVCLSLLGTWAGTPEEMWNDDSSIYQVLVSIQSLILIENPYYNEPSYQYKTNQHASDQYNSNVRKGSVKHGMIDLLKDKSNPFADAIAAHFRLKRDEIKAQVADWGIPQAESTELFDLLNAL